MYLIVYLEPELALFFGLHITQSVTQVCLRKRAIQFKQAVFQRVVLYLSRYQTQSLSNFKSGK